MEEWFELLEELPQVNLSDEMVSLGPKITNAATELEGFGAQGEVCLNQKIPFMNKTESSCTSPRYKTEAGSEAITFKNQNQLSNAASMGETDDISQQTERSLYQLFTQEDQMTSLLPSSFQELLNSDIFFRTPSPPPQPIPQQPGEGHQFEIVSEPPILDLYHKAPITVEEEREAETSSFDPRSAASEPLARKRKRARREVKETSEEAATEKQVHNSKATRSRTSEAHNLQEKRRRAQINEKMKALQELIPQSKKTNRISLLNNVIEYVKSLESQVQMLSRERHMVPTIQPGIQPNVSHPNQVMLNSTDVRCPNTMQMPPRRIIYYTTRPPQPPAEQMHRIAPSTSKETTNEQN